VLDFGLAKAIAIASGTLPESDPSSTPTITVHGTHTGVILGTAAYMSPEQARGRRIDKRTDIWAFGCVLFEMLTGKRAFSGETTSDVIAAIIERPLDLARLPAATPASLRYTIARAIEKDPKRRARDIADLRVELDREAPVPSGRRWPDAVAVVAVIAVVVGAIAAWRWRPPLSVSAEPFEFTFAAPPQHTLVPLQRPVLSPDGKHIAFLARDDRQVASMWIRAIDNPALRRLDGTAGVIQTPAWSFDSRSLAFFLSGTWKRISIDSTAVPL
jgi:serine/threonine protein kinase